MPREAEISVNEREFIQQALQENIRLDGRAFDAFRPLSLNFGDEYGVADVQLGKTRCALLLVTLSSVIDRFQSHRKDIGGCSNTTS
jgi:exosome complex RNA-binding protein Rrp42 (RNase PH superfamily)